jgi:glycopeptide antibiotics resistance protein
MPAGRVPLWTWWIALVVAVSLPWAGLASEPQWDRLYLLPFSDPEDKPRDLLANVMLFVPFGFSFFTHHRSRPRLLITLAAAVALSICAEAPQLFSTVRNPSATDVTAAVAGALGGALFRRWCEKGTG